MSMSQKRNRPYMQEDYEERQYEDNDIEYKWGLPDDRDIRMGFVKKVYGILTVQLLITAAVAGACFAKRKDPKFVKTGDACIVELEPTKPLCVESL